MKLNPFRFLIVPGIPLFAIWFSDFAATSFPLPLAMAMVIAVTGPMAASVLFWVFTGRAPLVTRNTNKP